MLIAIHVALQRQDFAAVEMDLSDMQMPPKLDSVLSPEAEDGSWAGTGTLAGFFGASAEDPSRHPTKELGANARM